MAEDVDVAVILGAGVMLETLDVLACEDALDDDVILGADVHVCVKEADALLDTLALLEWLNEYKGDHVGIEDAVDVREATGLSDVCGVPVAVTDSMSDATGVFDGHADMLGMLLIEYAIVYDAV